MEHFYEILHLQSPQPKKKGMCPPQRTLQNKGALFGIYGPMEKLYGAFQLHRKFFIAEKSSLDHLKYTSHYFKNHLMKDYLGNPKYMASLGAFALGSSRTFPP